MTDVVNKDNKHRTREQMPGWLGRFDDPYGITWRVANAIRRVDLARTARFLRAWVAPKVHRAPILIVGMPRSGTQLLFHVLRESPALGAMPREGHDVWRHYHHPRRVDWRSDHVGPGQVGRGEPRFVNAWFTSYTGNRRLIEKTADNVVRIPYLRELFPDAIFVVMKRNPCDALNSYINMWRQPQGRFRSYFVPVDLNIPGYPHRRRWCSTLIEGWRDLVTAPVPEIAFAQWLQYVNGIEEARRTVPAAQWVECHFEDLLTRPEATLGDLCGRLDLAIDPLVSAKLQELVRNPVNAMTPPGDEKWRSDNVEEVRALLPHIALHAPRLGYTVEPLTGTCDWPTRREPNQA